MRRIEFTKNFANKKKGKRATLDGQLASSLVRVQRVAKYVDKIGETDKLISKTRQAEIETEAKNKVIAQLEKEHFDKAEAEALKEIEDGKGQDLEKAVKENIIAKLSDSPKKDEMLD